MKQIHIQGKQHIYKCMKANLDENADKYLVREGMEDFNEDLCTHEKQFDMIRQFYLGNSGGRGGVAMGNSSNISIENVIAKKIYVYKSQDIKKEIYNKDQLITLDETVEKLVASKLKCCYCSCKVLLIYKNVREPTQWTLDRKDNDLCHSCDNTVIACLKCNLQRRVTNVDKFEFTKKLKIQKGF